MTTTFDTLKYVETLKAAGFDDTQAKGQAHALADVLRDQAGELATRHDMHAVQVAIRSDMAELKAELKADMAGLKTEFKTDLQVLKNELSAVDQQQAGDIKLIKWMLGFVVGLNLLILGLLLRLVLP